MTEPKKPNGGDDPPKRACENCHFFAVLGDAANAQQGFCRYDPPKTHFVPVGVQPQGKVVTAGQQQAQVQLVKQNYLPDVPADHFCHSHLFDDEPSPEEVIALALDEIITRFDVFNANFAEVVKVVKLQAGQRH